MLQLPYGNIQAILRREFPAISCGEDSSTHDKF
jgi:hypothetical protein